MNLEDYIKKHKEQFKAEVPTDLTEGFEALLDQELPQKKSKKNWLYWGSGIAASLALLLAVQVVLQEKTNTVEKEILLAMNNEDSSIDRLKGIYEYQELQKEDDQFIDKLIELLEKEENNNVKIATIDALKDFPNNEKVRKALIVALENEKEPIIQIELIKAISELREKRAKPSLQKVINNQKTMDYVKESALYTYNQLK
ncbi:hypothetical protein UJ101_01377 [Flavobacteriaceae bacterium UJ101]|nr:hypothetical protein UJ101_01377 [Flavobacteriaceae bacterium UJ101]